MPTSIGWWPAALLVGLVLTWAVGQVGGGAAQAIRKSQQGTVTQMIGETRVTIVYNRPVARGRELFGALVPYGKEWCPGADSATAITLSGDVLVAGQPLAAGEYTLWAIPGPDAWTIIFSRALHVWHTPYPRGQEVRRIQAKPEKGSHMETLAFYFPVVEGSEAVLHLHWGTTVVPIPLTVKP